MTTPHRRMPSASRLLPAGPGTYVLLLSAPFNGEVRVGKLGTIPFDGGWFLYVGSAQGAGGLRSRVGRHLSGAKKLHWHIDYLLAAAPVCEVWYTVGKERGEETWVEAFRLAPAATQPLKGFGSGDCGCPGHLFLFENRPSLSDFRDRLQREVGDSRKLVALTL